MGKEARNKTKSLANTDEVHDAGASSNAIIALLGVVENLSLQLDEISSALKATVNNGKNPDAYGKSTAAESSVLSSVDSERDVVGEFHSLKQTNSVAEYQEKFVELRGLMMRMNYGLTEGYFVSSFLSGLKQEIKRSIGNHKPETLNHAFNLARIKEIAIEVKKDINRDEERYLGCESVDVYIGVGTNNPYKLGGLVGERAITVLISTGVGYSFVDTSVATQAGCKIEEAEPLLVNFLFLGHKTVSLFRCPRFQWTMQGHKFVADVRIVELKAHDMVLGAGWVNECNSLTFSHDGILLEKDGKKVLLNKIGSAKSEAS